MDGPLAYDWARKVGVRLDDVWDTGGMSKVLTYMGKGYFWLIKRSNMFNLRQHLNTFMLAYLATGKMPPSTANPFMVGNAFYSAVAGADCPIPNMQLYKGVESTEGDSIINVKDRVVTDWIWKQWPYARQTARSTATEYNPIALLVAQYMQEAL